MLRAAAAPLRPLAVLPFAAGSTAALFATRPMSRKERRAAERAARKAARAGGAALPQFSRVWKQFSKKVHPDLFRAHETAGDQNADSFQVLQSVLNDIKALSISDGQDDAAYPAAATHNLHFYLWPPVGDPPQFQQVKAVVRTTGGDCRSIVQSDLSALFRAAGLDVPSFEWDKRYWQDAGMQKK
eukprot:PLAT15031.1.p1 GENE.PLAT15031.1~~PLAT15031.1.p1  ORF type:complete len:185 (+),score=53.56 PLAT15031.1:31-585(+)